MFSSGRQQGAQHPADPDAEQYWLDALSQTATSLPLPPPKDASRASAAHIEALNRLLIAAINARDFNHPIWSRQETLIEFYALDGFTDVATKNADIFRQVAAENPQYHLRVLRVNVDMLPEGDQEADCYLTLEVTGHPVGVLLTSIVRQRWRRSSQGCFMTSITAMRFPTTD